MNTGINRIRLEFKVCSEMYSVMMAGVLIESDWNLKTTKGITDSEQALVLIESDWNLKINFIFNKNGTYAY